MTSTKKRIRGNPVPLVIEDHPKDYNGYPFITLLQYRDNQILTIVDNCTVKHVKAYILDYCGPSAVSEEDLISTAAGWYGVNSSNYPLSIEISRKQLSGEMSKVYHSLNIEFVTRVIGPLPKFEMNTVHSIKRRRRKPIPSTLEVNRR